MVLEKNIDEINHRIVFAELSMSLIGLCAWKPGLIYFIIFIIYLRTFQQTTYKRTLNFAYGKIVSPTIIKLYLTVINLYKLRTPTFYFLHEMSP